MWNKKNKLKFGFTSLENPLSERGEGDNLNPFLKRKVNSQFPSFLLGFTFLEVVFAIFIIIIGVIGVFTLFSQTLGFSTLSTSKLVAAHLAQEGIEIVRNIRDTNWLEQSSTPTNPWDEGLTNCSLGCEADYLTPTSEDPILDSYSGKFLYIDGTTKFYRYISSPGPNDIKTLFKRKITITPNSNRLEVKVEVSWEEKGKSYKVIAQENLYNWK
jgi:type II secretory pathway pseudopilin PulG